MTISRAEPVDEPLTIWTIGHSDRPIETLVGLLDENRVQLVADVRRHPGSRKNPQYHPDTLAHSLEAAGITYRPFPELGGRRRPRPDSANKAWRNAAFRGYADYMETDEFEQAARDLIAAAKGASTALMCAEAVWWRCHRALISDALKADGIRVLHIMGPGKATEHPFTAPARAAGGTVSYRNQ